MVEMYKPVKIYEGKYIVKRCSFTGDAQNQSALCNNSAQTKGAFYNANTSST